MIDTAATSAALRARSPTPTRRSNNNNNNNERLKSVRYEDAVDGIPPLAVVSLSSSASRRASAYVCDEPKRDSAIAPSLASASADGHTTTSTTISSSTGPTRAVPLPTIVIQDDEATPASSTAVTRRHSPMARPNSACATRTARSGSPPAVKRSSSFTGIQTSIPEGFMADLDLEDLRSDKLTFSNRGSILFGGKKVQGVVTPQNDLDATIRGVDRDGDVFSEATPRGLVSGRRKPSVHMLQAAIDGGRVLSTEEVAFSTKVRNMYEFGDENGAPSMGEIHDEAGNHNTPNGVSTEDSQHARDTPAPLPPNDANNDEIISLRPPTANSKRASFIREPLELAGGIEDWEEVDGHDVDRYGFIKPRNLASQGSYNSEARPETVIPDSPRRDRKLRRRVSRSSRSLPPGAHRNNTESIRSFGSHTPGRGASRVFQSKDQRTLADAGDMLTLPPGLADIAEQEDAGRTASFLKRREWRREEKWQKMARPIKTEAGSNGGGMAFDFDTGDAKLISRTWKGVPDRWRATVWHSFLATSARRRGAQASDEELVEKFHELQESNSADDVQIDLDVPRTISRHIMFRRRYRGGQRLLFRVLHAVGLYFPAIGYVQGMASLAATLLCYYDEEKAFVMMVRMWQLRGLEQLFEDGFKGLMAALVEFEKEWLAGGDVAARLEELGITSTSYGTRWYLTLFNMSIPFPAQLRVWDVFMLLGDAAPGSDSADEFGGADLDVLHATSAALVDATREIIMDGDFDNAMKVLTSFIPIKDEDLLMRVARTEWRLRKKRGGPKA